MSVTNKVVKYSVHGAVTYGALRYFANGASSLVAFGQQIPLPVAAIGIGIASSMANDLVHEFVLPYAPLSNKLGSLEGSAVSLASGAGTMVGLGFLTNPNLLQNPGVAKLAMAGSLSEIISQYAFEAIAPMFQ